MKGKGEVEKAVNVSRQEKIWTTEELRVKREKTSKKASYI